MSGDEAGRAAQGVALDPISLARNSSGVVFVVLVLLVGAAVAVWFIAALKTLQLRRWSRAEDAFERDAARVEAPDALFESARRHPDAPGSRVMLALHERSRVPALLEAAARRALVEEQKRAATLMSALGSIGSAGPFVGLFGTVWGIMDAFLRIGREKSASLPIVAPAIGEALIATAVGLFAAIPAVIAYNAVSKRVEDLLSGVEASVQGWVAVLARPAIEPARSVPYVPAARAESVAHDMPEV